MQFHWPQVVWIVLASIVLVLTAALDGKPKTGNHSFAVTFCGTAFGIWLLWCGGFFQ